ncbi:MAG: efflux RND transporter periplasmic adaptor subunit [Flavobacteriales bacterium]|nr:MAG: efflux RND transporter periplasmic adaptor subunit [Flavobacteriales bacterium]
MIRSWKGGAAVLFVLASCGNDRETTKPTVGPIAESVYASGVVKAAGQYQVFPTATGQVVALLVREGDTVKAGTPLLRIDDRSTSASARSASAQVRLLEQNASDNGPVLAQLRESLEQARDRFGVDSANYERQKTLWAQQIGSKSELEQRELAYNTSRAAVTRAAKALTETRDRLRTELEVARNNAAISAAGNDDRSPASLIDGIVYDLLVEPGELATPQKAVAVIGSATDLYLELEVDEKDIARVQVGQAVAVTLELYDEAFDATVTRIIPLMDPRSRTFTVEARFVKAPPKLFPNITAEANILLQRKERAITIPASYLVDGTHVLTNADERTEVRIGLRDPGHVEILEGIDSNTVLYKP